MTGKVRGAGHWSCNRLEKYMTFFLNKNLVFIDSMQFMNSSLDKLVRKLTENDFEGTLPI